MPWRRLATIAATLLAAAALATDAAAQPVTLDYQQVATRPVSGATAAFSLDPSRVGASAQNGVVTLVGRGPGSTNVIVIVGDDTVSLSVVVGEPPVTVLPAVHNSNAQSGGGGYYEARYGSDPGLLQGNLFLTRREGNRSAELSLGGAVPMDAGINSAFSVPLASFTLRGPNQELTLLDRVISNSPLTVSRTNVRGVHLREGPWQLNAGYSFFGTFEHLLLPTDKEAVAGLSYRHRLNPRSSLTPNFYYFDGPRRGPLGSLFYEASTASNVKFSAELAASRSIAGALEVDVDRPERRAWAKLRVAPRDMPSLTTELQSGRQFEGGWIANRAKSSLSATVSSRRYVSDRLDQTSSVANLDLLRHVSERWTVHGGSGVSIFENASSSAPSIRNLTLPVGAAYSRRNVGAGLDYQFSRETTRDLGGHLVRGNVSGSMRGVRFSLFGERQTQAPTAQQILTDLPWLQPMLDRLGVAAATPQQLADLLRTNAELSAYGYANTVRIDITPVRTRFGVNGGWAGSGPRRPQLFVNSLVNRDESIGRATAGAVHSLSYSMKLDRASELFFTASALCQERALSSSCRPVMFASLRRTLDAGPPLLVGRRGHIDGVVFNDDRGWGMYSPEQRPMAGVEVVLDNVRSARTDSTGRFRFEDVPYGRHRVEARYKSEQPTYFTTPSPADVDTGGSVEFGIALARSSLRGVVRADAGTGLSGVIVHITGGERETTLRTADDGGFVAEGLRAGEYEVSVDTGSVPVGYPVDALAPRRIRVDDSTPGRVEFVLQPYRSVGGRARLFDRATGKYIALAGATVELQPIQRQSVTDANGQYAFRDVPPGEYKVVATHDGREYLASVSVPFGPAVVKNIDVAVVPAPTMLASAAPARSKTADRGTAPAQVKEDGPRSGELRAASVGLASAGGVFTIQVAESPNQRHARAMVNELKEAGHAAYLVVPASNGHGPYHVRVGQYSTLEDASRSARSLEKALGWRMSVAAVPAALGMRGDTVSYVR